jgi:SAM-dependent methyltransferase
VDEFVEQNRRLWDAWTPHHVASRLYDVAGFVAGRDTLDRIEVEGVGDVRGKTLLHLQCHFGMDTLSWARRGAVVTGADFSGEAILAARALARDVGLDATFVESDLYDLPARLTGRFDVVFTSYGVLGWLPDLEGWARVIAHFLAPGGTFFIAEGHPVLMCLDDVDPTPGLRVRYPYFHGPTPLSGEREGSYAAPDAPVKSVEHVWLHRMDEIIGALLRAGLRILAFEEHPHLAWAFFPWMVRRPEGGFELPPGMPSIPLTFSLKAVAAGG